MKKFLIGISYHEPETYKIWEDGIIEDYESSTGIFIQADSEKKAISWAEKIGDKLFKIVNPQETKDWKSFGHFCWVEKDWDKSGWSHCLDFFQDVKIGQFPDFDKMGTTAYKKWIKSEEQKKIDLRTFYEIDLDNTIEKYFIETLKKLNFDLYSENNQGMGAIRKYKNKYLKLQIINDRGLINLDISSKFGKEDFRDSEIINSLMELDSRSDNEIGKWQFEKILHKRLDFENQAKFLSENWNTLIKLFSFWNYKKTIKRINELGLKRSY